MSQELKRLRELSETTLSDAAEHIDVSVGKLWSFEQGNARVGPDEEAKLEKLYVARIGARLARIEEAVGKLSR
jgi:transcriptional regulator with XRE-family HTH domain